MRETVFLCNSCEPMVSQVMLRKADDYLKVRGIEAPRKELECLLGRAFSLSRSELYSLDVLPYDRARQNLFYQLVEKRGERYPLQYCLKESSFMDFVFYVDENCLIPRPETEQLVEKALEFLKPTVIARSAALRQAQGPERSRGTTKQSAGSRLPACRQGRLRPFGARNDASDTIRVLDMGTGSGNIAVSLARYLKNAKIVASDISPEALEVARKNAAANCVEDRINFVQGDLFEGFQRAEFDVIISNPPYVSCKEMSSLSLEVKREPFQALCGGQDGLDIIRRVFKQAREFLKSEGTLFLEIGFSQGQAVRKLCDDNGFGFCRIFKDYNGFDRIVQAGY